MCNCECARSTQLCFHVHLDVPCAFVYTTYHLFVMCINVMCLEMPSVHSGPSAFQVKRQQAQGERVQVASRADDGYELWTCFVSRCQKYKKKDRKKTTKKKTKTKQRQTLVKPSSIGM